MKANELRIGSIVKHIDMGESMTVTGIMQDSNGTKVFGISESGTYCNAWIEHLEPILLTDELLVRAKFKPTDDYFHKKSIGKWSTLEFAILHQRTILFENKKKVYCELSFCPFLHELQNLYFSLKGEELTITPKVIEPEHKTTNSTLILNTWKQKSNPGK